MRQEGVWELTHQGARPDALMLKQVCVRSINGELMRAWPARSQPAEARRAPALIEPPSPAAELQVAPPLARDEAGRWLLKVLAARPGEVGEVSSEFARALDDLARIIVDFSCDAARGAVEMNGRADREPRS